MTTKVVFLGTGDAFCSGGRGNTSVFIDSTTKILLDCGPHCVYGLRRCGYRVNEIKYIFITHLHGDHAGGLPFMLLNLLLKDRGKVTVVGPSGLRDLMLSTYKMFYGIGKVEETFEVEPLDTGLPFEFGYMKAKHSVEAYLYRIGVEGKLIVYTGDTSPVDLSAFAMGADLLIHEASESDEERAALYGHSTPLQAAEAARKAHAKRLALVHTSQLNVKMLQAAKEVFPATLLPKDLEAIEI